MKIKEAKILPISGKIVFDQLYRIDCESKRLHIKAVLTFYYEELSHDVSKYDVITNIKKL